MKGKNIEDFGKEWFDFLSKELDKSYMSKVYDFVKERRKNNIVYPSSGNVFNAYKLTHYNDVKVCIIGQDPYINPGEAHGLAFSTENRAYTPTLRQIETAIIKQCIESDVEAIWTNDLTRWTKQGVFLLNAVLTVDAGKSNSHKGIGWERLTGATVNKLSDKGEVVFLLWGNDAKNFESLIDSEKNLIIKCEHPVAASYQKREWNNNNCFDTCNSYLSLKGKERIKW